MHNKFPFSHVTNAIDHVINGRTVTHDGYHFKHDTYFDGTATLWHLFCVDKDSSKAVWHAWWLIGREWTPEDVKRANMNRMFSINEMCSSGNIMFYDPMGLIEMPQRLPATNVLARSQSRGHIRQAVYGGVNVPHHVCLNQRHPQYPAFGPSDFPFHPGPGLPGQFPFQHPQLSHVMYQSGSTGPHRPKFGFAGATLLALLGDSFNGLVQQLRSELFAALVDPKKWEWDAEKNDDPVLIYTYADSEYAVGIQRALRKILIESLIKKGYEATHTVDKNNTQLHITVPLSVI